jgi:hypothetical protein
MNQRRVGSLLGHDVIEEAFKRAVDKVRRARAILNGRSFSQLSAEEQDEVAELTSSGRACLEAWLAARQTNHE